MLGFLLHPYGLAAMALVLGIFAFQGWKVHYGYKKKQEGIVEVQVESKKDGVKRADKAQANRNRIDTDDKYFLQRLRKYCRDC